MKPPGSLHPTRKSQPGKIQAAPSYWLAPLNFLLDAAKIKSSTTRRRIESIVRREVVKKAGKALGPEPGPDAQRARSQMHLLSRRILAAQETERRTLSRRLHDEIGQDLTALKLQILLVECERAPAQIFEQLTACAATLDHTLDSVRDLSRSLRPSELDDFGLDVALRANFETRSEAEGLTLHYSATCLNEELRPEVAIACFRIAQEAMTNIIRHAHARTVNVSLTTDGDELRMTVSDDGCGYDLGLAEANAVKDNYLGPVTMRERAELVGGCLMLSSAPGKGTRVTAAFPLTP
jgi:signal transduction histidine kinase